MSRRRAVLLEYLTALQGADSPFAVGTVTAVDAAGAADGNDLVTVDYLTTEVYATYGDHYTPVVGHVVLMARTQPFVILCRVIGTPPSI